MLRQLTTALLCIVMCATAFADDELPPRTAPLSSEELKIISNPVRAAPRYPARALDNLIEGVVLTRVTINLEGGVVGARVVSAKPEGWGFEEAALAAVKRWKYTPPPRELTVDVEIGFALPADFKKKMRELEHPRRPY